MKIAVVGSGSWGLALAKHLAEYNNDVRVWSFKEEEKDLLNNKQKSNFLPDIIFPENLKAYTDFKDVIPEADIILHVTPSAFFRETVKQYKKYVSKKQAILICSKGFEKDSLMTLEEVLEEEIPGIRYGVLTGPSHAEEVSKRMETVIVVASKDKKLLEDTVNIFEPEIMRIYKSDDVIGAALGGALKNIIALCAGIVTGLELGDNTFAALVARGLVELSRFSEKLGANPKTIYGLTGLGDLIVTCMSKHSRNRKAGILIAKGYTEKEVKEEIGMVVEALDNIEVSYKLAKKNEVEMPIVEAVYSVLKEGVKPQEAITKLMLRSKKFE